MKAWHYADLHRPPPGAREMKRKGPAAKDKIGWCSYPAFVSLKILPQATIPLKRQLGHRCKNRTIASPNAARSRGVRLETKLPSTTTGSFTQIAPAFSKSSLMPIDPVTRRPFKIFAEIGIQPPWQINATSLPC